MRDDREARYREESLRSKRPLPFFTTSELHGEYQPNPYIVKQILDPGDWLTFFGDSGTLKTFLVIALVSG